MKHSLDLYQRDGEGGYEWACEWVSWRELILLFFWTSWLFLTLSITHSLLIFAHVFLKTPSGKEKNQSLSLAKQELIFGRRKPWTKQKGSLIHEDAWSGQWRSINTRARSSPKSLSSSLSIWAKQETRTNLINQATDQSASGPRDGFRLQNGGVSAPLDHSWSLSW